MSSTPGQGNGGRLDGAAEHADGDRQDIANSSSFEKRDGKRSVVELDIPSERNAGHSKISFLRHQSQRQKTNLALVPVETRHVAHKYLIRRPRALQVQYKGRHIELGDEGRVDVSEFEAQIGRSEALSEQTSHSSETSTEGKGERRSTDKTEVQRERLDLFIDLLWVGIISNISENFYSRAYSGEQSIGVSVAEFIILFVPAWSMWITLQLFLNNYYMDDLAQRIIIIWCLILGLMWGNNSPYFLNSNIVLADTIIATYLIFIGSLRITELVYSIWLPWLRRRFLVRLFFTVPIVGIWVGATLTTGWTQFGLIWAAVGYERAWAIFEASPIGDRLMGDGVKAKHNWSHSIKRFENFFIITLGEGVFLLVRSSPLGAGYTMQLGRGVMALLVYFFLHWIYFNGDQTKKFVHPVNRRWWIRLLWFFIHIPLFMCIVLLSSGMLYLIDYTPEGETNGVQKPDEGETKVDTSRATLHLATTTSMVSLSLALFYQLNLALLCKPLDPPGTLLIGNRYVRMVPRMAGIIVLATVWRYDFQSSTSVIGCMMIVVWLVYLCEWIAGLEKGGGILEPKREAVQSNESPDKREEGEGAE